MGKLTIIGVIVLMSISLLGVVGLQLYWISDAVRVKQEQFDRSVHEALAKVVEKLETREAVSAVANGMATLQHAPAEAAPDLGALPAAPPTTGDRTKKTKPQPTSTLSPSSAAEPTPARPEAARVVRGQATAKPASDKNYVRISYASGDSALWARTFRDTPRGAASIPAEQLKRMATVHGFSSDTTRLRIKGNNSYRVERISDSAITYTREVNGMSFRMSVDTLQYIALHMDSLWRNNRLNGILKPEDIASINILKDSIFILRNAQAARLHAQRLQSATLPGRVVFRNAAPTQKAMVVKEPPAQARVIVQEKKPAAPATVSEHAAQPDPVKVEAKKERLNDVVEKMVVEYVSKDVPLHERLNLANLKPMLQTELHNKGISLDFGYWVLSGQQDTVAAAHIAADGSDGFATYKANLFPNDIFDKPDYLAVYFTDSQTYALRSLWVMLLFSAGFTLVIVATFGTTIHIIFKQKKLSEMKNDFINNMTHEFKTPIATISLATDSIANPRVYANPEKIQYYTNIIRQENKRMNVQVENVLQIAQLEKNEFKMNLQPVDLHALIARAMESIRLQVEERLGQVTAQLHAPEHELRLDEVHAYNVVCNLLDNANKYSPSSPDIRLVTQNVDGGILLAVEDKGVGMTRDTQLRVFDKFYRVPTGNLHNVKGFGLGLSYVKAIVKAHHGHIRLQSEPGRGSRFEIFLPFNT